MKKLFYSALLGFLYATITPVHATPPIWDPVFGAELPALTGCDDCDTQTDSVPAMPVLLGFNFPFAGGTYNSISVNNNGGVALGNDNIVAGDPYVDFDIWNALNFVSDFSNVGNPSILVFNTDLSNDCCGNVGRVYFKTDGTTTATVTWVDAGTALDSDPLDTPFATFQLIMKSNGTMTFGYNGIGVGKDMIDNLDEGIVVGVSDGAGALLLSSDLSADTDSGIEPTVYEIWCYDISPNPSCYEPGRPDNRAFDLDQSNLEFKPNGNGGFTVTASTVPSLVGLGGGGGGGCSMTGKKAFDPTLWLLILISGIYLGRRQIS